MEDSRGKFLFEMGDEETVFLCGLCAVYWEQSVLRVHILINLHHFTIK